CPRQLGVYRPPQSLSNPSWFVPGRPASDLYNSFRQCAGLVCHAQRLDQLVTALNAVSLSQLAFEPLVNQPSAIGGLRVYGEDQGNKFIYESAPSVCVMRPATVLRVFPPACERGIRDADIFSDALALAARYRQVQQLPRLKACDLFE